MKRERESLLKVYKLNEKDKREMINDISLFMSDYTDNEPGIIMCEEILDFFLENLGIKIYNKALDDAQDWYKEALSNLEADFYALYKKEEKKEYR